MCVYISDRVSHTRHTHTVMTAIRPSLLLMGVIVALADPRHQAPYHPPTSSINNHDPGVPVCASITNKTWCLEDSEYPTYDIKHALENHYQKVLDLYTDVADLNTQLSVEGPKILPEETYLCSSETSYVKPLRAQNSLGKWRFIVNDIEIHYERLTQTTHIEECLTSGSVCPLVPVCYESKCLQKSIYHRFLVYDPYDKYFPFAVDNFKLPSSCACLLDAYTINHLDQYSSMYLK
nr:neurotrophin 1-like [Cherax quadricarinatus]